MSLQRLRSMLWDKFIGGRVALQIKDWFLAI